jgi:hypothetical protein
MTFEIGEEDDEAREVVEALDEEAITITLEDSQRIRERLGMPLLSPALLKRAGVSLSGLRSFCILWPKARLRERCK